MASKRSMRFCHSAKKARMYYSCVKTNRDTNVGFCTTVAESLTPTTATGVLAFAGEHIKKAITEMDEFAKPNVRVSRIIEYTDDNPCVFYAKLTDGDRIKTKTWNAANSWYDIAFYDTWMPGRVCKWDCVKTPNGPRVSKFVEMRGDTQVILLESSKSADGNASGWWKWPDGRRFDLTDNEGVLLNADGSVVCRTGRVVLYNFCTETALNPHVSFFVPDELTLWPEKFFAGHLARRREMALFYLAYDESFLRLNPPRVHEKGGYHFRW
jgi:hypothetical protein